MTFLEAWASEQEAEEQLLRTLSFATRKMLLQRVQGASESLDALAGILMEMTVEGPIVGDSVRVNVDGVPMIGRIIAVDVGVEPAQYRVELVERDTRGDKETGLAGDVGSGASTGVLRVLEPRYGVSKQQARRLIRGYATWQDGLNARWILDPEIARTYGIKVLEKPRFLDDAPISAIFDKIPEKRKAEPEVKKSLEFPLFDLSIPSDLAKKLPWPVPKPADVTTSLLETWVFLHDHSDELQLEPFSLDYLKLSLQGSGQRSVWEESVIAVLRKLVPFRRQSSRTAFSALMEKAARNLSFRFTSKPDKSEPKVFGKRKRDQTPFDYRQIKWYNGDQMQVLNAVTGEKGHNKRTRPDSSVACLLLLGMLLELGMPWVVENLDGKNRHFLDLHLRQESDCEELWWVHCGAEERSFLLSWLCRACLLVPWKRDHVNRMLEGREDVRKATKELEAERRLLRKELSDAQLRYPIVSTDQELELLHRKLQELDLRIQMSVAGVSGTGEMQMEGVRRMSLGRDRWDRGYWCLDGRLCVCINEEEWDFSADACREGTSLTWYRYENDALDALRAYLNPLGLRESELLVALKEEESHFQENIMLDDGSDVVEEVTYQNHQRR